MVLSAVRVAPLALAAAVATLSTFARADAWGGYANDPQHTAISPVASQPLQTIKWQTPVDLAPPPGEYLLLHYGSPSITSGNTVIVPVKTATGFQVSAFNGTTASGASPTPIWTQPTDYTLPPTGQGATYSWTPPYSPALSNGTLYYAGAGGTVYSRSALDTPGVVAPTQRAFYGIANYNANQAAYNAGVGISTPITADSLGNIYFGYQTTNSAPGGITNGIARISAAGVGTFFQANQLTVGVNPAGMTQVVTNCAPALSPDGSTVYVAMSNGNDGRLVALNSTSLAQINSVPLIDPQTNTAARLPNIGTASPTVGPDGDIYFGVLDNAGTSRGFLTHFSAALVTKPAGGFGWDDTASIVPASMVPGYSGTSTYLIMTKYNNYAQTGGKGDNRLAILDPNATQLDTRNNPTGQNIMKEILTIKGPTIDDDHPGFVPDAVKEWCINTAAVDPLTKSILVNSEDGSLYRWDLTTNTLTQAISITAGIGEAYTPTAIGPDGTVYAINNAILFAVGAVPEPTTLSLLACGIPLLLRRRRAI